MSELKINSGRHVDPASLGRHAFFAHIRGLSADELEHMGWRTRERLQGRCLELIDIDSEVEFLIVGSRLFPSAAVDCFYRIPVVELLVSPLYLAALAILTAACALGGLKSFSLIITLALLAMSFGLFVRRASFSRQMTRFGFRHVVEGFPLFRKRQDFLERKFARYFRSWCLKEQAKLERVRLRPVGLNVPLAVKVDRERLQ